METRFRVRKVIVCLMFIFLLLVGMSLARSEYVDLREGGVILAEPVPCKHFSKVYICVPVEKDKRIYMVLGDNKGEALIYEIVGETIVLIWSRDAI